VRIAGVQTDVTFADVEANLLRIERAAKEAAGGGAELIVFPECALTGYCFDQLQEAREAAEPIPGPSCDRLAELAASLDVHLVVGMLESSGEGVWNACALIGPEGVTGSYRKVHLPYLGVDRFARPGDRPFAVYSVGPLKIGMHICYDGSFPEAARVMALAGADLLVLPTNWPPAAESFARYVINTRALENNVYALAVNRVGQERGFDFIGLSRICAPDGTTLSSADDDRETILYADIDPQRARQKRLVRVLGRHEIDRFADRRPEFYGTLSEPRHAEPSIAEKHAG